MKYFSLAFAIVVVIAACSATSMIASWNEKGAQPKKYQKMAVVALAPDMDKRATVEDAVVQQFRAKGIKANATFNTFPFAGKIGELNMDTAMIQQKIRQRVNDNNFDALLTIAVLDKKKEQRYVEGSSISIAAPVYGYPYYGYYSYAYSTVYSTGYYTTSTSYFIETNVYDVATEKLIYTAQTKTEDPTSIEKESANFAKILVGDILTKKVIEP